MRTTKCIPSTKRVLKSFSLVTFIFSLFLASCGEEIGEEQNPQAQSSTTFTIETPVVTRATMAGLTRYIVEAYEGKDLTTTPVRVESSAGSLTIALKKETDYTFLFWADKGTAQAADVASSGYWNTASLKSVAVATDKKNDVGQAAYCLCISFNSKDFEANKAVTLKNATAQVNFVEATGLITANNTLKVTYAAGATLNVGTGKVTEVAGKVVHTYTAIAKADPDATLAADYVLAPLGEQNVVNLTVQFNAEAEKTIDNVPFQQSHRTNIRGEYSDLYNSVFTISNEVADYEDGGEVETELPPFTVRNTTKGKLKEAIAAAKLTTSPKIIILGPVNDVDVKYAASLTTLTELDLSGATLWGKADTTAAETGNTLTYNAFKANTTLTTVTLPTSLKTIEAEAFSWCIKLATVTFTGTPKLEVIEVGAFEWCTAVTSIAIPESVTRFGMSAFRYGGLENITLLCTTMIPFARVLFVETTTLTAIYVPTALVDAYKAADGWKDYADKIQAIQS